MKRELPTEVWVRTIRAREIRPGDTIRAIMYDTPETGDISLFGREGGLLVKEVRQSPRGFLGASNDVHPQPSVWVYGAAPTSGWEIVANRRVYLANAADDDERVSLAHLDELDRADYERAERIRQRDRIRRPDDRPYQPRPYQADDPNYRTRYVWEW